MDISLKDRNKPLLAIVILANMTAYLATLNKGFSAENWANTLNDIQQLVPAVLISALTGILNAQIGHVNKARLVFWKYQHPLPGSHAFTEYINTDVRIDKATLLKNQSSLPIEPNEQNALWFKWYREFQNEPSIKQVHREYLFTRDYAGISILLLISLGPLAFWQMDSVQFAGLYLIFLIGQYLVVRKAAQNHGIRFVTSVLAYKSSNN